MISEEIKNEVVYLYLDDIIPNRFQPREVFDEKALKELAVSIKEHGVIQPIIVRRANNKYEIIAGERRYKASALAGATKIPAIVRNLDDKEAAKVALLENLQRKNLNAIEEARTYQKILELDQMTQEELAKTMGKSQSAVANKIRLLSLPMEVQDALLKEKISERHARTLVSIDDSKLQQDLLKKIISEKMSVRKLEEEIKMLKENDKKGDDASMDNQSMSINQDTISVNNVQNQVPQYINYGEVDNDIDNEENDYFNKTPQSFGNIDLEQIKSSASDIKPKDVSFQTSLDSMLNIASKPVDNNNVENKVEKETSSYESPAEKIDRESSENNLSLNQYFNNAPTIPEQNNNDNKNLADQTVTPADIPSAIQSLRNTVNNIKNHNINIQIDEMDFNSSYQIIIKIEK